MPKYEPFLVNPVRRKKFRRFRRNAWGVSPALAALYGLNPKKKRAKARRVSTMSVSQAASLLSGSPESYSRFLKVQKKKLHGAMRKISRHVRKAKYGKRYLTTEQKKKMKAGLRRYWKQRLEQSKVKTKKGVVRMAKSHKRGRKRKVGRPKVAAFHGIGRGPHKRHFVSAYVKDGGIYTWPRHRAFRKGMKRVRSNVKINPLMLMGANPMRRRRRHGSRKFFRNNPAVGVMGGFRELIAPKTLKNGLAVVGGIVVNQTLPNALFSRIGFPLDSTMKQVAGEGVVAAVGTWAVRRFVGGEAATYFLAASIGSIILNQFGQTLVSGVKKMLGLSGLGTYDSMRPVMIGAYPNEVRGLGAYPEQVYTGGSPYDSASGSGPY